MNQSDTKCKSCCDCGPGYASPQDAFLNGPREKGLFVTCPNVSVPKKPDAIVTVDVDPESSTYCKVISKVALLHVGDEAHHTGWNACSSCFNDTEKKRHFLVVPCLASELLEHNLSTPHTSHCLGDGNIMISTLGDKNGEGQGNFALPRCNVMISTEWGAPNKFRKGFDPLDAAAGNYGHTVHIWDWEKRTIKQSIPLEKPQGMLPFEIRFLHEPTKCHAFMCTALGSALYHLYRDNAKKDFKCRLAAEIPSKTVLNWQLPLPEMPGLCTDIIISMDDRYLYMSQWLHGDIRQYDISDPFNVKQVGQCFLGGSIHTETTVTVVADKELECQPPPLILKDGKRMLGGPQMLQLSLDGKRLYVTNSLFSVYDKQFFPEMAKQGSTMLQLDVDTENGGIKLNRNFQVDFSDLEDGPYLAHEMRYPGVADLRDLGSHLGFEMRYYAARST
uniref:Methanethiol oxidase n=1 Tax=Ditylenchus dipsaci TaxID=166011 RepID=A0A915DQU2_9BILA